VTVVLPVQFGIGRWHFALTNDPEEMVMTIGFEAGTGVTTQACADAFYNAWTTAHPTSGTDSAYTFNRSTVTLMQPGGLQVAAKGPPIQGSGGSINSLPNNCALLVRKVTGFSARKMRGRMYQPPFNFDESGVDRNGLLAGATLTTMTSRYHTLFTTLTGGPTILSLRVLHSDATSPTVITDLVPQQQIGTQRNRMRK